MKENFKQKHISILFFGFISQVLVVFFTVTLIWLILNFIYKDLTLRDYTEIFVTNFINFSGVFVMIFIAEKYLKVQPLYFSKS